MIEKKESTGMNCMYFYTVSLRGDKTYMQIKKEIEHVSLTLF